MKNRFFILPFIFIAAVSVSSCGSGENKTPEAAVVDSTVKAPKELTDLTGVTSYYECPMKCEGKKFSEPGNCPICGMELVLVEVKNDSVKTAADTTNKM